LASGSLLGWWRRRHKAAAARRDDIAHSARPKGPPLPLAPPCNRHIAPSWSLATGRASRSWSALRTDGLSGIARAVANVIDEQLRIVPISAGCEAVWYSVTGHRISRWQTNSSMQHAHSSMHHHPTSHAKSGKLYTRSGHQNVTERCAELLALNVKPARATRNSRALEAI
jgi:hypothetical protein